MTFKILSLDGGGIRGALSVRLLQEVERQIQAKYDQRLDEYFDLIAGTSTGSLIAAGLCLGKNTQVLLEMYRDRGQEIFPKHIRARRKLPIVGRLISFLYPHGDPNKGIPGLSTVLQNTLGDVAIADVGKKITTSSGDIIERPILLVMAYDTLSRNTSFFVSNNSDTQPRWYDQFPLWRICTASASAPTFFPPYDLPFYPDEKEDQVLPHIDGGVSVNNPSLAAVSHALGLDNVKFEDISVLSIGTGKATEPYTYDQIKQWQPLNWISNLPNMFLHPGDAITDTICSQLLNAKEYRHLRLDFEINHHLVDREDPSQYKLLRNIDPEPVNQYLMPPKYVSEAIDDPDAYDDLITATQAYLEKGYVVLTSPEWVKIPVKEAIARFIKLYPPRDHANAES
ncbi:MAG: patatin-like phospholipase family protein [Cyanothece sp. SIO2G6]|nr:patatin-like phospholipase family protein [Cyanothece sp. SIO2G6]